MKIFQVQETYEDTWVLDPDKGALKERRMRMKPSTTSRIQFHDGRTFEVGPDMSFDLPDDVAKFFLRMPGWHEGISPYAEQEERPSPDSFRPPRVRQAQ